MRCISLTHQGEDSKKTEVKPLPWHSNCCQWYDLHITSVLNNLTTLTFPQVFDCGWWSKFHHPHWSIFWPPYGGRRTQTFLNLVGSWSSIKIKMDFFNGFQTFLAFRIFVWIPYLQRILDSDWQIILSFNVYTYCNCTYCNCN